jgi:hypothetical protein
LRKRRGMVDGREERRRDVRRRVRDAIVCVMLVVVKGIVEL